jgi:hypothetical protein
LARRDREIIVKLFVAVANAIAPGRRDDPLADAVIPGSDDRDSIIGSPCDISVTAAKAADRPR